MSDGATTHYGLTTTHYSLRPYYYSLLTTHYSPLTTHHSLLPTPHSPLPTYYSPLTAHGLRQVRLVSGVGQGVKDFGAALLDVKGLLKSPEDFGRNLATGSLSLTRSVLAGSLQPATCNPI